MATRANFNSIKVRLERVMSVNPELRKQFQFHKGAIRTTHIGRSR